MSRRINIISSTQGEEMKVTAHVDCICERPNTKVFCRQCGFFLEDSRVRAVCRVHPQTFYLLDMDTCPQCNRSVCRVHPQTFYLLDMDTCPQCNSTGKLQEVLPFNPSPQLDWMDAAVPKLEPLAPQDPTSPPDNKNFYKRSAPGKLPVLSTLSANTKRVKAEYRYSKKHNGRSYIKQQ